MCKFNNYLDKTFILHKEVGNKTVSTIYESKYRVAGYIKLSNSKDSSHFFSYIGNSSKEEYTNYFILELLEGYPFFTGEFVLITKEKLDKYLIN